MSGCPCKNKANGVPSVIEINNPSEPVLFHKVTFPASVGDDSTHPATTLNYKNVLLFYEANNHAYLYSSDGAPTFISMGELSVEKIMEVLREHGIQISELQEDITTLQNTSATKDELNGLSTIVNNTSDEVNTISSELTTAQSDISALTISVAEHTTQLDTVNNNLNIDVEQSTNFNGNDSTLDVVHTKINLSNGQTTETTDALPVASTTQAGIMNAATFIAVQENSENIDSILVGAVALSNLPVSVTQEQLTEAWKAATGKTNLVNRATILDETNKKLWSYYSNTGIWYDQPTGEVSITVNQATNDTLGTVKGSTLDGQNFAEADGTLSVNGWDTVKEGIANNTSGLSEANTKIEQLVEQFNTLSSNLEVVTNRVTTLEEKVANLETNALMKDDIMTVEEFNTAWEAA